MRVLFFINSFLGGGTERSALELYLPLAGRGVQTSFVCLESRPGVEQELRGTGAEIEVLGTRAIRKVVPRVRDLIRRSGADVLHTALFEADVLGRIASVGTGVPVLGSLVNTSYGPERLIDPNVRRYRLEAVRLVDGWTGRHLADHFHAVSRAVKQSAESFLKLDGRKITVVERGRDPDRLGVPDGARRQRVRALLGIDPDAHVVVNVGRLEFQKDQRCLIDAVSRLPGRETLRVLIAGRRGNASAEVESALAASGVADRVTLLGHRDDVPDLLAAADLLVSCSRYEGMPGVIIEAMCLGLPIVSTAIPPVHEVVEQSNAVLYPAGDSSALAAALGALLDDPGRRSQMGRRSREIFLERFTLDRSAQRMAELYRLVAESRKR